MKCIRVILPLLLLGSIPPAKADWVELGAALRCAPEEGTFELVATARTSEPLSNAASPPGFQELALGQKQIYTCALGTVNVKLTINVYGPQARGLGQGAGVLIIDSLLVSDVSVIDRPTNFNWKVSGERVLTKVRVQRAPGENPKVELCTSDGWSWELAFDHESCAAPLPRDEG